ncbi:MAG: GNAT family N-acetyltransferase [Steroidobacteraceae bacterium]
MTHAVTDNCARRRFEFDGTGGAAFIDYRRDGEVLTLAYVLVPPHLRGRGVAAALVEGTLRLARARGERVVAQCSFAAAYIHAHPEFHDLLAVRPPAEPI